MDISAADGFTAIPEAAAGDIISLSVFAAASFSLAKASAKLAVTARSAADFLPSLPEYAVPAADGKAVPIIFTLSDLLRCKIFPMVYIGF